MSLIRARGSWNRHSSTSHCTRRGASIRPGNLQPFLTPVPAHPTPTYIKAWLPFGALFALVRITLLVALAAAYALLVDGVLLLFVRPSIPQLTPCIDCAPQSPIPPLYRFLRWLFTAFLARVALSTMGFWWIDVDTVFKKRSYNHFPSSPYMISDEGPPTAAAGAHKRKNLGSRKEGM